MGWHVRKRFRRRNCQWLRTDKGWRSLHSSACSPWCWIEMKPHFHNAINYKCVWDSLYIPWAVTRPLIAPLPGATFLFAFSVFSFPLTLDPLTPLKSSRVIVPKSPKNYANAFYTCSFPSIILVVSFANNRSDVSFRVSSITPFAIQYSTAIFKKKSFKRLIWDCA